MVGDVHPTNHRRPESGCYRLRQPLSDFGGILSHVFCFRFGSWDAWTNALHSILDVFDERVRHGSGVSFGIESSGQL